MASNVKAGTTNAQNRQVLSAWCSVNEVLRDISPRWKMVLLHGIAHGVAQFSRLKQAFPTLSDQVLGQRLAELVAEGLVEKAAVANTVPPQIRYSPTPKGHALLTIIDALQRWGQQEWSSDHRGDGAAEPDVPKAN
ncbi:helix-turn-helix transcriptional regulator [Hymenobacter tibetensis]|uniref:Helix-turn-helix transcriptional regulator n=1 Tax=Hymenobacter tibetensis TaxID=497967 RepID=A0ABY4CTD4_9BACT|nr:helix-turn-helix domain-containing protein [Hymenobacter tibetensis]UOG73453.1 helix-turn-helix transcriptional regulator [Hymenobacter tibetensis]